MVEKAEKEGKLKRGGIMDREFIILSQDASLNQLASALKEKEMIIIADKKGKPKDVLTRMDLLIQLSKS